MLPSLDVSLLVMSVPSGGEVLYVIEAATVSVELSHMLIVLVGLV